MPKPFCEAGLELERWLEAHGKSQQWLCEELGMARVVLWRWLTGERTPHIDSAAAIERLTGINASTWSSKPENRPAKTGTDEG